ncbi:MAG: cofactor-independent phosphoglycerate mutase [Nitrospirae bacterium]|nr:cofactor-independent phosphoglycerate mutase [Nitrospirota bacterium]
MKYIVLIGDGMADWLSEGPTPLQRAKTPNMDMLAVKGTMGMVSTIPKGFEPGSDVANLCILGYDPAQYYCGRAPLEAASMGVALEENDAAYRCNLVTIDQSGIMVDYSAGHITTDEARELIIELDKRISTDKIRFHPGVSYRHLMVWADGEITPKCTPPHDITGKNSLEYLPSGDGSEQLNTLIRNSMAILSDHKINKTRKGKNPANSIWLWGQGRKPLMPKFKDKYRLNGALISAVDLTKGLGVYAGFDVINVPGATGYIDTNYTGKAEYGLKALEDKDFLYLHIEAPDEAGHSGNVSDKIRAIEDIDQLVLGKILSEAGRLGDFKILLMPDHATPIKIRTHSSEPVPFIIYDSTDIKNNANAVYSETINERSDKIIINNGYELMDYFIKGMKC